NIPLLVKRKSYKLSIPEPCSESWNKMAADGVGRHCSNCNKTIIDFSTYTDNELAAFLQKTPHGCGRFATHQLGRSLILANQNSNNFFQKALLGSALLAGITSVANGQAVTQSIPPTHVTIPGIPSTDIKENNPTSKVHSLRGMVIDKKTKEPLADIDVIISGTDYKATTDSLGAFSINVPDSLVGKEITLEAEEGWWYKAT